MVENSPKITANEEKATTTVSEKMPTLKFVPSQTITRPGRPNTDHYIDTHLSCESKTV